MNNCVYRIININNNKVYIGSTIDSERRRLEHASQLDRGVHTNTYLQNSYNKHGKGCFVFDIIESNLDENDLLKREQHYMNLFNSSDRNFGYNISNYANRPSGKKYMKVFTTTQRNIIKHKTLSNTSIVLLYFMQGYILRYTNRIAKPNKSDFTNKELQHFTGLSDKTIRNALNELESSNVIKRCGQSKARKIYFNPNIAINGSEVQQEIYDMFK